MSCRRVFGLSVRLVVRVRVDVAVVGVEVVVVLSGSGAVVVGGGTVGVVWG